MWGIIVRAKTNIVSTIIFLVFVLAVWLVFIWMPQPSEVRMTDGYGNADLSEGNFDDTIYFYHDYWDSYPQKLYTPEDFDSGAVSEAPQRLDTEDYQNIDFATHRLELNLPAGVTYGLSTKSSDFSMRIYINGELIDTVGNPTDSKETNVPRTAERTYFFTPQTDTTVIVAQATNWVHREGSYSPSVRIGTAREINFYENYNLIMTFLILGGLLAAFLYHLGLFVLNRSRKPVLVFALCCLLLALMTSRLIPLFFPEYNWYVAIGFEYIVHFLTFAMLVLFLDMLFLRLYQKFIARIYYILAGVFILLSFILPTEINSNLIVVFDIVSMVMAAYTLVRLAMQLRERKLQNLLALIGVALVCLFGLNDVLYQNNIHFIGSIAGQRFTTPIAMLFFVFCYGLVIALDYAETERKMIEAQKQVKEAEERYLEMRAKADAQAPLATPDDFGLSDREKDVLWLLLDGKSRQEIADLLGIGIGTVHTYFSRIYQKTGTNNMGGLFKIFGLKKKT